MARSRKTADRSASGKRLIEQHDHRDRQGRSNPPVRLVTEAIDRGDLGNHCAVGSV